MIDGSAPHVKDRIEDRQSHRKVNIYASLTKIVRELGAEGGNSGYYHILLTP